MSWNYENKKPVVKLVGEDDDALSIMGRVRKAMQVFSRKHKDFDAKEEFKAYKAEAMSGDYDHLLRVTMKYCDIP